MNVSLNPRASRPAVSTAAGRPKLPNPGPDYDPENGSPEEAAQQAALTKQRLEFNFDLQERAELQREMNELCALQMEQLKRDDEIVKKWIAMI
ncbi:MAG: hypothetical protein M3Z14_01770 [Candidatus Eremiobacteraeota bacterium]|nr:hypothetical protein [Candidatus Eremiobacteraeota bacterium]